MFSIVLAVLCMYIYMEKSSNSLIGNGTMRVTESFLLKPKCHYFQAKQATVLGCGCRGRPPDMKGSSEYTKLAVADSRQGVIIKYGC